MAIINCPDCKGDLENGAILDFTYGGVLIERYAKTDIPTTNKMMIGMHEANFNDVRRVMAKRCTKCNRIFMYAQDIVLTSNLNSTSSKRLLIFVGITLLIVLVILFKAILIH